MPKANVKQTLAAIRALGMSARYADGEYRVNFRGGAEATASYTNDAADAIATAEAMQARTATMLHARTADGIPHGNGGPLTQRIRSLEDERTVTHAAFVAICGMVHAWQNGAKGTDDAMREITELADAAAHDMETHTPKAFAPNAPQPSEKQLAALAAWKRAKGRTWKQQLRDAWYRAGQGVADYTPELQQLRNAFGPEWLDKQA